MSLDKSANGVVFPARFARLAGFVFLILSPPLAAADGDLDLTFHAAEDGIFQAGMPGSAQAVKVLPAPDGATVVVFHYELSDGTPRQDRWLRVTSAGSDTVCPLTGGSVTGIIAHSAIFDRQGRLVVVGTDYDDTRQAVVERFLYPDCTLDPEFDGNGLAGYLAGEIPIGVDIVPLRLAALPFSEDYYYLVATLQDPETQVALLRLNLDGSPDTSWGGGDGRVEAGLTGARVFAADMEIDAHGRLVVAVTIEDLSPDNFDFGVFRFLNSGTLDSTFDGNGKKLIQFDLMPNGYDRPFAIALSSDDHIAVVGTVAGAVDGNELGVAVVRENGAYESDFDGNGLAHFQVGIWGEGAAGIYQGDGKLLVGGQMLAPLGASRVPAFFAPYVARLMPDGSYDPGFGEGGVATPGDATFAGLQAGATSMALDGGRPVVGGYAWRAGTDGEDDNFFLLRLENRLIFADSFESRNSYWW
jgi:uncharacterized delta-60 repeat protein